MDDKKTRGNKKMRSAAVKERMMQMMQSGEAPRDMKSQLDQVSRESDDEYRRETRGMGMKSGGSVKSYKKGGSVSSCSKRADGIAQRGKTKCKMY